MKINVNSLDFSFPANFDVIKFDDRIESYKNLSSSMQFPCECEKCPSRDCEKCKQTDWYVYKKCTKYKENEGLKGVDIIAIDLSNNLYLIESKDYSKFNIKEEKEKKEEEKKEEEKYKILSINHIADEVAKKFRDTLFAIWCGGICDKNSKNRSILNRIRTQTYKIQFIFHFESPIKKPYKSGLLKKIIPITNMQDLLRTKLSVMQNYVKVYDMDSKKLINYPWTVTEK